MNLYTGFWLACGWLTDHAVVDAAVAVVGLAALAVLARIAR